MKMSVLDLQKLLKDMKVSDEAVRNAGTLSEATANTARSAGIRGCPGC
jgi:hypothetical protein|tara:strand:- start:4470 stop:4613 length:144 start_codon:yes stop_codon:yes gene_type:complete